MPIANTSLFETTIAALATPTGAGALGIVRLSGPKAWTIAQALFTPTSSPQKQGAEPKPWTPRLAQLGVLQSSDGLWIDQVLLLPFKGPHSATGEDVVEFHCHGSPAVLSAVLKACLHEGALAAQPGEFTQRAFVHGRLDLTQAESVLDLIHTHSPRLMDAATHNLHQRTLQQTIQGLCEPLIALQSQLTACVDFPDEVDEPPRYDLLSQAQLLEHQVQALLSSSRHNAPIRQGLTVVLVGAPNAGKSSLFNALLTQDRAIVTPLAGTTRDTLHETLWINGIAVTLVDTAGLRNDHADMVEALGIERTREAIEHADAVWLWSMPLKA
ncbi:MAG: tRNA uridine-5-carboxymethylaminomethyl(34) synthesis GTPase MnmE [Vampirovibrionales bacterium]